MNTIILTNSLEVALSGSLIWSGSNLSACNSGLEVIKLFSCSTQLSTKFQILIKTKIPTNEEVSWFKSLKCCMYYANKC